MAENFISRLGFIPDASPEEIRNEAVIHASEVIRQLQKIPGSTPELILQVLAAAVRIGVMADGKIDQQEDELIRAVFAEICDGSIEEVLRAVNRPLDDRTYKIAEDLLRMSAALGMEFVSLAVCFAYADGVLEEAVSERLSDLVTACIRPVHGNPGE